MTRVAHNRAVVHAAVHEADRAEVHEEDHEAVHEADREAARGVDQEDLVDVAPDVGAVALVGKMPDSRAALALLEDPAVVLEAALHALAEALLDLVTFLINIYVSLQQFVWQAFEKVLITDVLVSVIHSIHCIFCCFRICLHNTTSDIELLRFNLIQFPQDE